MEKWNAFKYSSTYTTVWIRVVRGEFEREKEGRGVGREVFEKSIMRREEWIKEPGKASITQRKRKR